jgi:hypothetical protein
MVFIGSFEARRKKMSKRLFSLELFVTLLFAFPGLVCPKSESGLARHGQSPERRIQSEFLRVPLIFEANFGQTADQVKFLSRRKGYSLFLTSSEAVLALSLPAEQLADWGGAIASEATEHAHPTKDAVSCFHFENLMSART